jgi:hypothetical protein
MIYQCYIYNLVMIVVNSLLIYCIVTIVVLMLSEKEKEVMILGNAFFVKIIVIVKHV